MENSRSRFGGNLGISSGNTSLISSRMRKYSMHCSLSDSTSRMFIANNLQPFLTHFFTYQADICLTKNFFGMPWTFTWFPRLSIHKIDLCKQLSMTWCCSNQSMPISTSYDPKGRMFRFTFIGKPFRFTSHSLIIFESFYFIHVAKWTGLGLSCLAFPSLHSSTILGKT